MTTTMVMMMVNEKKKKKKRKSAGDITVVECLQGWVHSTPTRMW